MHDSKFTVLIHKDETSGYWGECPELPGCWSQGETIDELMSNIREAAALYLEDGSDKYLPIEEIREVAL